MESAWTSLEIVKVIISLITPIIGGIIAFKLTTIGKKIEKKQWFGRKIIEKRLEFYDSVVPVLNDLYCYYKRVGNWKEITPPEIIDKKRKLDRTFNIYSHIFKNNIMNSYQSFIHNCFETYTGSGNDAKIKMELLKRVDLANWNNDWNNHFVPEKIVPQTEFENSYFSLLSQIKNELEIE